MKPQMFTCLGEIISNIEPPAVLLILSSALIGLYLRFYNFSFALLKLLQ